MKVLVIEDDPTDRKLMVAVLRMSGHSVRESMSAEAALDAIVAEKPDVILLDQRLPVMDGLMLVRQLKMNARTSQIPIVAVSPQELAMVATGKTNKEIAAALRLSPKTVKNYLSNIFDKLQIKRRAEAAARFSQIEPQ